jgi:hypothetical protein
MDPAELMGDKGQLLMSATITRRRVLRLTLTGTAALASVAVAMSGPLLVPTFAGPSTGRPTPTVLVGVRAGTIPAGGGATAVPVLVQLLDVATGQVRASQVPQLLQDGTTSVLEVNESIDGCAVLADGTLVLAITPVTGTKHATEPARLTRLSQTTATTVSLSGLKQQEQLSNMAATLAGTLLGLVEKRNGTPPMRLVTIDPQTGSVTDYARVHLPGSSRFTTLTQCPDGRLYSTTVDKNGETSLVQLDTGATQLLTFNGAAWNNGLASLACSPDNQLFALGAPRYQTPNAVYTIDLNSGAMSWAGTFDAAKFANAHL